MPNKTAQDRWFEENLSPHEPMLRAWLGSRYPRGVEIDDVIQEAYLRVFAAKEKGHLRSAKAFLFAVARNLALDRIRHAKVAQNEVLVENDLLHVLDGEMGIPETVERNQELELLTQAIQSLPVRCRQIFTLKKVYGMSQKDIARKLGVSENTVSTQLTIGLHKCRQFFKLRSLGKEDMQ